MADSEFRGLYVERNHRLRLCSDAGNRYFPDWKVKVVAEATIFLLELCGSATIIVVASERRKKNES